MKRYPVSLAIVAGVLVTTPLIAIFLFGWQWFGFPFPPFDLFDRLSRLAPGSAITHTIELIVYLIRLLHLGATDTAAKAVEQSLAVISFFSLLVILGSIICVFSDGKGRTAYLSGLIAGFLMTLLFAAAAVEGNTAQLDPFFSVAWILVWLMLWGAALAWIRVHVPASPPPAEINTASVRAINRRQLLVRLGEASALITVAGAAVSLLPNEESSAKSNNSAKMMRWSEIHPLPNANAAVKPAPGTRPEFTPLEQHYRIDINTEPPIISEDTWNLQISGLVEKPLHLTLEELKKYEPMHQFVTLSCISNLIAGDLIGTTRWTGVSVQRILQEIRPLPGATHLRIISADGFYETVALDKIRRDARVMLTYGWDGLPLTAEHGFPLRIYVPDLYGMKQPKWIRSIEVIDHPEEGYWVERGWDPVAQMRATSVIDTMSGNMMMAEGEGHSRIPLGGIAHAGARGISKVQVQVDDEPWVDARLRTPLSETTWVIWRFDWPFRPGRHSFTVRCFEGDGTPQITTEAPPHPSGATGLHSIKAML